MKELDAQSHFSPPNTFDSYVTNCFIERRQDDRGVRLFENVDGKPVIRLDGYAIVPIEKYRKMCLEVGKDPLTGLDIPREGATHD